MTQPNRAELVDKYFRITPTKPNYTGLAIVPSAGGLMLLVGLIIAGTQRGAVDCLAVLFIIGGIYVGFRGLRRLLREHRWYTFMYKFTTPKATGAQMDQWLDEGRRHIVAEGQKRLNLGASDLVGEPLVFTGLDQSFIWLRDGKRWLSGVRGEEDGVMRFPVYEILVVYLANYRISTYTSWLEMRTGRSVRDRTQEYHLTKVDGVDTQSDRESLFLGPPPPPPGTPANQIAAPGQTDPAAQNKDEVARTAHITSLQLIQIKVSGDVALQLLVGLGTDAQLQIEGVTPNSDVDTLVFNLRQHLRRHMGGSSDHAPGPMAEPKM